jgi:hypothetical protein
VPVQPAALELLIALAPVASRWGRPSERTPASLTVSPEEHTILLSGNKPSPGDDLMLIRNFR